MGASRHRIVFAGSGTAGHFYPGVRIAGDLVGAGSLSPGDVVFVGASRGTGREAVEAAGFSYRLLESVRPLRGRSPTDAGAALAGAARSLWDARGMLRDLAPAAVVGIGGYASFPVVAAAWSMGIPVTVLQVDAAFGLANGLGALLSGPVPVAFPAGAETFESSRIGRAALRRGAVPRQVRPCVRHEIEELARHRDRSRARELLGLDPKRPLVVFVGGSLGAGPLNDAAFEALERWDARGAPQVVEITGRRYFDSERSRLLEGRKPQAKSAAGIRESIRKELGADDSDVAVIRSRPAFVAVSYATHIERLYEAADVVVSRAGAATVGELAVSGTPAVLMPSSFVVGDHQSPNAEALARRGGAVIAYDSQSKLVPSIVERLLERPEKLEAMRRAALHAASAERAAYEVVAEVGGLELPGGGPRRAEAVS